MDVKRERRQREATVPAAPRAPEESRLAGLEVLWQDDETQAGGDQPPGARAPSGWTAAGGSPAAEEDPGVAAIRAELYVAISRWLNGEAVDRGALLQSTARYAAGLLDGCCAVHLTGEDGRSTILAAHSRGCGIPPLSTREMARRGSWSKDHCLSDHVLLTGEPVRLIAVGREWIPTESANQAAAGRDQSEVYSILVVPIRHGDRITGTVSLIREKSNLLLTGGDQALLQVIADTAALLTI